MWLHTLMSCDIRTCFVAPALFEEGRRGGRQTASGVWNIIGHTICYRQPCIVCLWREGGLGCSLGGGAVARGGAGR